MRQRVRSCSFTRSNQLYLASWKLIHSIAPYGPKAFVNENFNFFGKILSGKKQLPSRDTVCIRALDGSLGELLGKQKHR